MVSNRNFLFKGFIFRCELLVSGRIYITNINNQVIKTNGTLRFACSVVAKNEKYSPNGGLIRIYHVKSKKTPETNQMELLASYLPSGPPATKSEAREHQGFWRFGFLKMTTHRKTMVETIRRSKMSSKISWVNVGH